MEGRRAVVPGEGEGLWKASRRPESDAPWPICAHTACCVHMWCLIARPLGRGWVCVLRGAGGSGGGGGAGWHALWGEGETSTNTMYPQDCQEWCASPTLITGQSRQGQPPPRMFCLLSRAANVRARAYAHGHVCVRARA